jgi:hypothetical protein
MNVEFSCETVKTNGRRERREKRDDKDACFFFRGKDRK